MFISTGNVPCLQGLNSGEYVHHSTSKDTFWRKPARVLAADAETSRTEGSWNLDHSTDKNRWQSRALKSHSQGKLWARKEVRRMEGTAYWGEEVGNNNAIVTVELVKVREDKLYFVQLQNTRSWGFLGKQRVGPRNIVSRECGILVRTVIYGAVVLQRKNSASSNFMQSIFALH